MYRDEKTCAKNIHLCLSHHDVYEIARLIDSRKQTLVGKNQPTSFSINT